MNSSEPLPIGTGYGTLYKITDTVSYIFVFASGWALAEGLREYYHDKYQEKYNKLEIGIMAAAVLFIIAIIVTLLAHSLLASDAVSLLQIQSREEHDQKKVDAQLKYWNQRID